MGVLLVPRNGVQLTWSGSEESSLG